MEPGLASKIDHARLVGWIYAQRGTKALLVTCVGEDEGVNLVHHSIGNQHAGHKRGDWTYEIDNAHQITLRYWLNEFRSIAETVTNSPCVTTPQERSDLQKLILHHVRTLKAQVDRLKS